MARRVSLFSDWHFRKKASISPRNLSFQPESYSLVSQTSAWQTLVFILTGCFVMTISSQICLLKWPVPITAQTLAAALIGSFYSPLQAFSTMMLWIGLGASGFPVFAGWSSSLAPLLGTTAGYIFGMAFSAWLMAVLTQSFSESIALSWRKFFTMILTKKNRYLDTLSLMAKDFTITLIGTASTFVFGLSWLHLFMGSWQQTLEVGFYPFILPGFMKAIIFTLSLALIRKS